MFRHKEARMTDRLFTNKHILDWLHYFAENTDIDLEKVKILDITRKNKFYRGNFK